MEKKIFNLNDYGVPVQDKWETEIPNPENANVLSLDSLEPTTQNYVNWGKQPEDVSFSANIENPSVIEDLTHYNDYKSEKMKAELFDRVYESEQLAFFQENKRFMNSAEKKNLKKHIIKLIDKDLLIVNNVGKIQLRKSNFTPAQNKKKKRRK